MKIVIVGDGIAARTTVSAILRQVCSMEQNVWREKLPQIHLLRQSHAENKISSAPALYTGLWSQSVHYLVNRIGVSADTIRSTGCAVQESGYRSKNGAWLMKPNHGLQDFPNRPSLYFFENQKLLNLILEQSSPVLNYTESNNVLVEKVTPRQGHLVLTTSNQEEIKANLVIVADGMQSRMKRLVSGKNIDNFLSHRGYQVFRGVCSACGISSLDPRIAFQTWGSSARFAVVPINDYRDIAWFAALSSPPQRASEYFTKRFTTSPLTNGVGLATEEEIKRLVTTLRDWHSPIPEILQRTISESPIWLNEAFASSNPLKDNSYIDSNSRSAILFIGDANFTLDPILAQGAGIAIEEAVQVVDTISQILQNPHRLRDSVREFERRRSQTLQKLHQVSNLAQFMGHQDSIVTNQIRDAVITAVPSRIKGALFDQLIGYIDRRE